VHVTLDMGGQARLGPDVQWLDPPAAAEGSAQHAPDPAGSSSSSSSSAGQGQGSALAGQQRLQPHLPLGQAVDYSIDPQRGEAFYAAVRSYYPGLKDGSLQAAYCGVRPKLSGPGQPAADFVVSGPAAHGVPGLVNLFGIESPGLTSSLALARMVAGLV
jgi:L-2-hydroxyglutarate oxidase LhgO